MKKPERYGYYHNNLPQNIHEALKLTKWKPPIEKELNTIKELGVWEDAEESEVVNPLNTTWAFRCNKDLHSGETSLKAWVCVQWFNQRFGIDYFDTFLPTGKVASLRALLSYSVNKHLKILQFNVKGAFIHAPLDEDVFIKTPGD